jgi:hypothetical protein
VGRKNVEAQQSWEYLYGPMAFFHTHAPSTVGIVLLSETEENGQIGAYLDADPKAAKPIPVIPEPESETGIEAEEQYLTPATAAQPLSPPALLEDVAKKCAVSPTEGLIAALLILVGAFVFYFGLAQRRRKKRKAQKEVS